MTEALVFFFEGEAVEAVGIEDGDNHTFDQAGIGTRLG
jgi:hypothetical protein